MIDISLWIERFLTELDHVFAGRVWFVGLQGSYGRGEATENSDIDMVVILEEMHLDDIARYNAMLDTLPNREKICGFLAGKAEFLRWEPSDLFQLYYDTTPIRGSMDAILPMLDRETVNRAIKFGACNIFHGCVHNMLYGKKEGTLRNLYKNASFVVQAIAFRETGRYERHQSALLKVVSHMERDILSTYHHLKNGGAVEFSSMSETLVTWAKTWIERT